MKKAYVLDTNVLLHDPLSLHQFQENDIVLPITIVEELDRFKKQASNIGRNARLVSRILDEMRAKGHLIEGIDLGRGGQLRVALSNPDILKSLPPELEGDKDDNAILAVALDLKAACQCPVVLVSKDTNLRIKADALGLDAEDYETDKVDVDELYAGTNEISVDANVINALYLEGKTTLPNHYPANQALTLVDSSNPSHTALAIATGNGCATRLDAMGTSVSRIRPRNREQKLAFELLLRPAIQLVTLVGKAGTGKTLLAIAAGLHQVADNKEYTRLLIARPVVPMGSDIGYLPGDITEKLAPWMQPLYDNFDLIFGTQDSVDKPGHWKHGHEELTERGLLQIEPLTYIRGRTIPKQYLIVDEAQNLTPHEVKTILTRAGEGTKIVLTGDLEQIDNPYVDAASNGLTYVIEKFREEPLAGHILLKKGERSELAERAAVLL
ncbi:MAG: PhoH family protein [Synechococcus sp.]